MGKYMDQARQRWQKVLADREAHAKAKAETVDRMKGAIERETVYYKGALENLNRVFQQFADDTGWLFKGDSNSDSWRRVHPIPDVQVMTGKIMSEVGASERPRALIENIWCWGSEWRLANHDGSQKQDVKVNVAVSLAMVTADLWDEADKRHDPWEDDLRCVVAVQANAFYDSGMGGTTKFVNPPMWVVVPSPAQSVKPSELMEVLAASIFMLGEALGEVCDEDNFWKKKGGYSYNEEERLKIFVDARDQGYARFMQDLLKRQSEFSSLVLDRVEPPKSAQEEEAEAVGSAERGVAA